MLQPRATALPFLHPETRLHALAGFAAHAFRATRYRAEEMHPAGRYPSQALQPGGVAVWASDDEPIAGEDIVVWYTIGVTHVPRPEEYPVMPAAHAGVILVPAGFFAENPAMDVPASR
jgi:primary-amine oxidase